MCHRKISDDTSRLFFRNRFSNQCVQLVRMPAIRNGVRTSFRRLAAGLDSGADIFDDSRQEGNENNRHYQDLEIVLDKRLVSEQVNGAKVLTIGTKRAMTIVFPPYFL